MAIKNWKCQEVSDKSVLELVEKMNIPLVVAQILCVRGFDTQQKANEFLSSDGKLYSPFLLKDMDKAVERIEKALADEEKILIYGDYDADGVTSVYILYSYLESRGADVVYYIPKREGEGYGLSKKAITKIKEHDINLIITVDNGISAYDEIEYANRLGMDVVVTDHHRQADKIPNAIAVVNPNRLDCEYPNKGLCGVGVAFKLICALEDTDMEALDLYSAFVCIGTIADVMPITGENRKLVKIGLEAIANTDNYGLQAIIEVAGIKAINAQSVAFGIVPRINAAGRLGEAKKTVDLLLCEDEEMTLELAKQINDINIKRQEIETDISKNIIEIINENPKILNNKILVFSNENWHHGVLGIAAARIAERYAKPCVLFTKDKTQAKGSGRSVEGFSLFDAIVACSDKLLNFGGHTQAVGLSLNWEDIDSFYNSILLYTEQNFSIMPMPSINIDLEINSKDINLNFSHDLKLLEPFGKDNNVPIFILKDCKITGIYDVSNGKHLKFKFNKDNLEFYGIYFNKNYKTLQVNDGGQADIIFSMDINEYNGKESISLVVKDIRPCGFDSGYFYKYKNIYDKLIIDKTYNEKIAEIMPTRDDLVIVYKEIKQELSIANFEKLYFSLFYKNINYCKMMICLDVFCELKLIKIQNTGMISLNNTSTKVSLDSSILLNRLKSGEYDCKRI